MIVLEQHVQAQLRGRKQTRKTQQLPIPVSNNTTFSVLSMEQRDQSSWHGLVPAFFNYSDTSRPIPSSCFRNVAEANEAQRQTLARCRANNANSMQHGREPFHQHIFEALAEHLVQIVLPHVAARSREHYDSERTSEKQTTRCIGSWGTVGQLQTKDALLPWNASIVSMSEYSISNPFTDRRDKISLNSNSDNSTLTLSCPSPFNESIKIGYIAHADPSEAGTFSLNGSFNISTWLEDVEGNESQDYQSHARVRTYTPLVPIPVRVSIVELQPGAYIEFTDVACY